jgi:hypothetical protein
MSRSIQLYLLNIVSIVRRLRYHVVAELVIALCSAVLLALFFYLFGDFLRSQTHGISQLLVDRIASSLGLVVLTVSAGHCGHTLALLQHRSEQVAQLAARLGEEPRVLRTFYLLMIPSLLTLYFLPSLAVVSGVFPATFAFTSLPALIAGMLVLTGLSWGMNSYHERSNKLLQQATVQRGLLTVAPANSVITMGLWRIKQMIFRHRRAQYFLGLAVLLTVLNGWWSLKPGPVLMSACLAFLSGLAASQALILQIAADSRCLWLEKDCGISHRQFFHALELLGWSVSGGSAIVTAGVLLVATLVGNSPRAGDHLLQMSLIAATCPLLVPYLALQIDIKRWGVQAISVVLLGILLATAIFAHILAGILIPVVIYYGRSSQKDRFYYT